MNIDTRLRIETPEGVELQLRLAGPHVRFYAWLIDVLIRSGIYLALFMLLLFGLQGVFLLKVNLGLFLILIFLLEWFYPVFFELRYHGMTPGKRLMKIRAIHDDGTEIGWRASLIRNLLRYIDVLPVYTMTQGGVFAMFVSFGLFIMFFNRQFKRLGDMAAGSVVVYHEPPIQMFHPPSVHPVMPPWPLTIDEQKALLEFSERAGGLTPERQAELANHIVVLTRQRGDDAVAQLHQYASWLAGRR